MSKQEQSSDVLAMLTAFSSYTVREMINNRLLWLAVGFSVVGLALASFISEVAVTEHVEVQLAIVAASYRFCAVFVMMVFVVATIVREFNDKCLELYLSMPVSRLIYFVGKCLGFIVCGAILAVIFSVALLLNAEFKDVLVWGVSLTFELAIVAVFAFFSALTFNQQITSSLFVAFFFYLLSRLTDTITLISESLIIAPTLGNLLIQVSLDVLFTVLPRFSIYTQTDWLVYGSNAADLLILFSQTIVYCVLIGGMAMWDFSRKNI